jgi:hypothetical protein
LNREKPKALLTKLGAISQFFLLISLIPFSVHTMVAEYLYDPIAGAVPSLRVPWPILFLKASGMTSH